MIGSASFWCYTGFNIVVGISLDYRQTTDKTTDIWNQKSHKTLLYFNKTVIALTGDDTQHILSI